MISLLTKIAVRTRIAGLIAIVFLGVSVCVSGPALANDQGISPTNGSDADEAGVHAAKTKTKSGKLKCKSGEQVRVYSMTQGTTTVHQFKSRGDLTNDRFKNDSYKPVEHHTFTGEREAEWKIIVTPVLNRVSLTGGAACYPA